MSKTKATFNIPDNELQKLKTTAGKDGTTVTAALRGALHRDHLLREEKAKGSVILVKAKDGSLKELVFG